MHPPNSHPQPHTPTPPTPPALHWQVFDECSEARAVPAPAVLGVEALLQHVDSGCGLRPYGYRCVASRCSAASRAYLLAPILRPLQRVQD